MSMPMLIVLNLGGGALGWRFRPEKKISRSVDLAAPVSTRYRGARHSAQMAGRQALAGVAAAIRALERSY
jgi:hypothetical protein